MYPLFNYDEVDSQSSYLSRVFTHIENLPLRRQPPTYTMLLGKIGYQTFKLIYPYRKSKKEVCLISFSVMLDNISISSHIAHIQLSNATLSLIKKPLLFPTENNPYVRTSHV